MKYVSTEFGEVLEGLAQIPGYVPMKPRPEGTTLEEWLSSMCTNVFGSPRLPDAIILWELDGGIGQTSNRSNDEDWARIEELVEIIVFADDLHYFTDKARAAKEKSFRRASQVLSTYAYLLPVWYPSISAKKVHWLPHSAGHYFTYGPGRLTTPQESKLLVSGALSTKWYPCRTAASRFCEQYPNKFTCLQHPGYGARTVGRDYYPSVIANHTAALATSSILNYVVGKFFEIPATGTLMVANQQTEPLLKALGLEKDKHYKSYDCSLDSSLVDLVDEVSSPESVSAIDSMRRSAQDVIRSRHTVMHRVWQIHARTMAGIESRMRLSRILSLGYPLSRLSEEELQAVGVCFTVPAPSEFNAFAADKDASARLALFTSR